MVTSHAVDASSSVVQRRRPGARQAVHLVGLKLTSNGYFNLGIIFLRRRQWDVIFSGAVVASSSFVVVVVKGDVFE